MAEAHLSKRPREAGFTLVEVLVALAVVAVASAGLIGAAESQADTIRALQTRAEAQWVAENRIAELIVAGDPAPAASDTVEMLGRSWVVQIAQRQTEDPELAALTLSVLEEQGAEPLARMDFFLDRQRSGSR